MSDPVTNAEVEDVLSSIRRLVSEDKRPVQVPLNEAKSAAVKPAVEPRKDRLVLTPALRVTDAPRDTATPDNSTAASQETDTEESLFEAPRDGENRLGATDRNDGIEINSLVSDDSPLDLPGGLSSTQQATDKADVSADEDDQFFDDLSQDYSTDPYNFDDDSDNDGDSDDDFNLRHSTDQQRPPEGPEDDQDDDVTLVSETEILKADKAEVAESNQRAQNERLDETGSEMEKAESAPGEQSTTDTSMAQSPQAAQKAATLTAKIAALETAIGQISETWEPDDAGESDYAGSEPEAMAWEDDEQEVSLRRKDRASADLAADDAGSAGPETTQSSAEEFFAKKQPDAQSPAKADMLHEHMTDAGERQDTDAQPEPDAGQSADEDPEFTAAPLEDRLGYSDEDQLIDEEALRDLVSDIVRQELQGALGERITRNVRKLVRREIHRALTAQELE
ncbi:hypothetical protein OS190_14160 [Sulfitobacter sp. F26204]|uniref:hypothetical protein n=1 Tax=Sulfitobacter sp. F26204 TaxID=2996014 RepID=UPI00225E0273|nr:hypothetical protein [Sulfitobacter sp. F26204]MCX7560717.1 hypothetical protein [Sulfitobacter sp. F26204]